MIQSRKEVLGKLERMIDGYALYMGRFPETHPKDTSTYAEKTRLQAIKANEKFFNKLSNVISPLCLPIEEELALFDYCYAYENQKKQELEQSRCIHFEYPVVYANREYIERILGI